MGFWHAVFGIYGGAGAIDTDVSIYYQLMEKVVSDIQGLGLTDIDSANVQLAKVLNEREAVFPGLPGILVLPLGQEQMPSDRGTNNKDYIGYPVAVVMMDIDRLDQTTDVPTDADGNQPEGGEQDQDFRYERKLIWREKIRKHFINQRVSLDSPAGADIFTCHVEPNVVVEPDTWLETNLWVSSLVFRFWSRETRG